MAKGMEAMTRNKTMRFDFVCIQPGGFTRRIVSPDLVVSSELWGGGGALPGLAADYWRLV